MPSVALRVKMISRRAGRVHERACLLACRLERGGCALGELVDAAVHAPVRARVELAHRGDHLARLLRRHGRVEIGERLALDHLLEDREVGAELLRVQLRLRAHGHEVIVPPGTRPPGAVYGRRARRDRRSLALGPGRGRRVSGRLDDRAASGPHRHAARRRARPPRRRHGRGRAERRALRPCARDLLPHGRAVDAARGPRRGAPPRRPRARRRRLDRRGRPAARLGGALRPAHRPLRAYGRDADDARRLHRDAAARRARAGGRRRGRRPDAGERRALRPGERALPSCRLDGDRAERAYGVPPRRRAGARRRRVRGRARAPLGRGPRAAQRPLPPGRADDPGAAQARRRAAPRRARARRRRLERGGLPRPLRERRALPSAARPLRAHRRHGGAALQAPGRRRAPRRRPRARRRRRGRHGAYDPRSGRFRTAPGRLDAARSFATATALRDGRVLVAGGYDEEIRSTARAWVVSP